MFNSLWLHGVQHVRLPCSSSSPRFCPSSCPLNWWCHPNITSSVTLVSFCLQSFPASGSFPMSQLFVSGSQSIWRRQWYPTPVLLPGKSHGRKSLVGCSPWGHKESDMTEWLSHGWFALLYSKNQQNLVKQSSLNRTALWPSNPTAEHTHWGNQKGKRHVYPTVHCSTIYNSQDMETT